MAFVAGRWFTVIKFMETSRKVTTRRYEQSAPADYAAAQTAALALVTDFAAVTDAEILSYHVYQENDEDTVVVPSAAEIQNEALLSFSIISSPNKFGTVAIPAAKASIFSGATGPQYDIVDIEDSNVAAFADNWLLDDLYWLSDGETADALEGGKRRHRKSASS